MSDKVWKPGWYADRLHLVTIGDRHSACGHVLPPYYPEWADWWNNKMRKGVPKCKKCLAKADAALERKELESGEGE